MINQVVIVGRLTEIPKIIEKDNGKKFAYVTLAVDRSYKNENGDYEKDLVKFLLNEGLAENTIEYVKKGDLLGIKGRLETRDNELVVHAEKITFLHEAN